MPCTNHPETPEAAQCAGCSQSFCINCLVVLDDRNLWGPCKAKAVRSLERGENVDGDGRTPSPWEREKSIGSLLRTCTEVLLTPTRFFKGLPPQGRGHWSFLFALEGPSFLLGFGFLCLLVLLIPNFHNTLNIRSVLMLPVGVLVCLVLYLLWILLLAGLSHLMLKLLKGTSAGLGATWRIVAYAQATLLLQVVLPVCGFYLFPLWFLVTLTLGLRAMHRTSLIKALAATLLSTGIGVGLLLLPGLLSG